MPVNLVSEDELRDALRPYCADPKAFEAGVRERLEAMEKEQDDDPLADLSPLQRSAAALLPLPLITGGKISAAASAKLVPASGAHKLLGYLAFPAISLFVLLGATVLSVAKIRASGERNNSESAHQQATAEATGQWWCEHKKGFWFVLATTIVMQLIGATWLLFLMYIVSFGLLLFVLSAFAKVGMGNRGAIGLCCMMALMSLGQLAMFAGTGDRDIHFVDQHVIAAVFIGGALFLTVYLTWNGLVHPRVQKVPRWIRYGFLPTIAVPLIVWLLSPLLWPATPPRIKAYVESCAVPLGVRNWDRWEIVASWAVERKLDPDFSRARRLLAEDISDTPILQFILGSAMRLGLVTREQLDQPELLKMYEQGRKDLLQRLPIPITPPPRARDLNTQPPRRHGPTDRRAHRSREKSDESATGEHPDVRPQQPGPPGPVPEPASSTKRPAIDLRVILSLKQKDWLIRAAVLRGDLTTDDRNYLEERLHATMEEILAAGREIQDIEDPVHVTRMLAVIDRPVDPERYRERMQKWLLRFHCQAGGGFQPAGGFEKYFRLREDQKEEPIPDSLGGKIMKLVMSYRNLHVGALPATACAVELMETYGIPSDLDLNWVRTYLKPSWQGQLTDEKWIAAVTLDRLNHLPGATRPSWLDMLYYERSLLAAMVLVGLCIYATLSSPKPKSVDDWAESLTGLDTERPFPWKQMAASLAFGAILTGATLYYVLRVMPKRFELPPRAAGM